MGTSRLGKILAVLTPAASGVILILAAGPTSPAQSILEVLAGAKFCKTITADADRLRCFDGLFVEGKQSAPKAADETPATWSITESKSPLDDSPQVSANLDAAGERSLMGGPTLVLRCKEKKTEAYFVTTTYLGSDPTKVLVRINEGKILETSWSPSTDGRAVFAPSPIPFIRALPDNGKLFIRATGRGSPADGEFNLGNVTEVREKISQACRWSGPGEARPPAPQKK